MSEKKKMKIMFSPNCFADFQGSQEDLDKLVEEIKTKIENLGLGEDVDIENAEVVPFEDLEPEIKDELEKSIIPKKLH